MLRAVVDAEVILKRIAPVGGWLSDIEARLLIIEAERACQRDGALVEIGSYLGRSTIVLASVAQQFGRVVHAIDPHEGDIGYPAGYAMPTWDEFHLNIGTAGLSDSVVAYRMRSLEFEPRRPVGLLFIDGHHTYEACKADFEHFEPVLTDEAIVLFHDYGHEEPLWDVRRVVDALVASGSWRMTSLAGELAGLVRS